MSCLIELRREKLQELITKSEQIVQIEDFLPISLLLSQTAEEFAKNVEILHSNCIKFHQEFSIKILTEKTTKKLQISTRKTTKSSNLSLDFEHVELKICKSINLLENPDSRSKRRDQVIKAEFFQPSCLVKIDEENFSPQIRLFDKFGEFQEIGIKSTFFINQTLNLFSIDKGQNFEGQSSSADNSQGQTQGGDLQPVGNEDQGQQSDDSHEHHLPQDQGHEGQIQLEDQAQHDQGQIQIQRDEDPEEEEAQVERLEQQDQGHVRQDEGQDLERKGKDQEQEPLMVENDTIDHEVVASEGHSDDLRDSSGETETDLADKGQVKGVAAACGHLMEKRPKKAISYKTPVKNITKIRKRPSKRSISSPLIRDSPASLFGDDDRQVDLGEEFELPQLIAPSAPKKAKPSFLRPAKVAKGQCQRNLLPQLVDQRSFEQKVMLDLDKKSNFDIDEYCQRVQNWCDDVEAEVIFEVKMRHSTRRNVSRHFLALLCLLNKGFVKLSHEPKMDHLAFCKSLNK